MLDADVFRQSDIAPGCGARLTLHGFIGGQFEWK
jgi:hypothetical protein